MALQTIQGGLWIPTSLGMGASAFIQNSLMDADGEKVAIIIQVPKTGTLQTVDFKTGAVTTGDDIKVSFQDVDLTTGAPDETVDEYAVVTIQDTDDFTWVTSLGVMEKASVKRSVTKGDFLAIVFEFDSYVAGNLNLRIHYSKNISTSFPYINRKTVGSWAKVSGVPAIALEYDDGSHEFCHTFPADSFANQLYNSSDTGSPSDEIGLRFKLPGPCRVIGFWFTGRVLAGATIDFDGTTVHTLDSDVVQNTGDRYYMGLYDTPKSITADTYYRQTLVATTTTDIGLWIATFDSAVYLDALSGGQEFHMTERVDGGGWTDTTTKRPAMGIIIDQMDDGVGAVGGISQLIYG